MLVADDRAKHKELTDKTCVVTFGYESNLGHKTHCNHALRQVFQAGSFE